jgi:hypothetical protein
MLTRTLQRLSLTPRLVFRALNLLARSMSDVVEDVPVAGADGEALSKNEIKRRAKAAEKEKEKAEKAAAKAAIAAAAPPKAAGSDAPKVAEEEVDPSKCVSRLASRAAAGLHRFHRLFNPSSNRTLQVL